MINITFLNGRMVMGWASYSVSHEESDLRTYASPPPLY